VQPPSLPLGNMLTASQSPAYEQREDLGHLKISASRGDEFRCAEEGSTSKHLTTHTPRSIPRIYFLKYGKSIYTHIDIFRVGGSGVCIQNLGI
jgi:hypothetical protein